MLEWTLIILLLGAVLVYVTEPFWKVMIILMLVNGVTPAWAQAPAVPADMTPPKMMELLKDSPLGKIATGQIHGRLSLNGKALPQHTVIIQVQQDGQTVLTLPKKTNDAGDYLFKNIFRDPQFSYTLFAEHEGHVYRLPPVQLAAKQNILALNFELTPNKQVGALNGPEMLATGSPRDITYEKAPRQFQTLQWASAGASILVLLILGQAYRRIRKQQRKV